jgi:hypothetical protein
MFCTIFLMSIFITCNKMLYILHIVYENTYLYINNRCRCKHIFIYISYMKIFANHI